MKISTLTDPTRIWVIDGAIPEEALNAVSIPDPSCPGWVEYDNALEKKRAINVDVGLGLQSWPFVAWLAHLSGIDNLQSDPSQWGAGIHVTFPGGFLAPHVDAASHRVSGLERKLNVVVYLTPQWDSSWGGATVFYDSLGESVIHRVYPKQGRILVWECNDYAVHGVEEVKGEMRRVTVASYYYAPVRPARQRALFIPPRKNGA